LSTGKGRRGSIHESVVERYLVEQVEKHGGLCEKFVSPGRRGVPDRLVTWPAAGFARLHLVELKTVGGRLDPAQVRDHARRKKLNCEVFVLWTLHQVDVYVERFKPL
jgi:hypothetical protein